MKKRTLLAALTMSALLAACGGNTGNAGNAGSSESAASGTAPVAQTATGVLNIYNWSDYVDPDTVTAFETANGVKISYDYYDSNEVLEAKVLTGKSGYDLVVPSSSSIGRQIQAGAYLPIDKSQIANYNNISPELLKLMEAVDPGNQFAVPYFFGTNTIGINRQAVEKALGGKLPEDAWDLVFNPEYTAKLKSCGISFLDSPSEVFPLALHYLKLDPNSSNAEDLKAAAAMMQKVRGDISRFSSSGYINDLARGDLCVVIGYSGDINIAATRAQEANAKFTVQALMPQSGAGIWIDSFAIPKDAANVANAYKYINHTLDAQVAAKNGNFVTYAPASQSAKALMDKVYTDNTSIFPTAEDMQKGFVIKPFNPDGIKLSVRLWQTLKAGN
ncbi:MAG: polyamine ABC transporter substrate-binding protein [Neisseria sp.]|nr:polyamine ABC transporter substrate-binding protein [Neisseria sp.]